MKQLKAKFRKRDKELNIIIQGVLKNMENNPDFPNSTEALAKLKKVQPVLLEALGNAQGRDRKMVSIKNDVKIEALGILQELADYVTLIANGDRTLILSSGFDVTSGGLSDSSLPPSIDMLEVSLGQPGEATTYAKRITGAKAYLHQYCKEPPGIYTEWMGEGSSQSRHTFHGLSSDKRYWFRVVAIGFNKQRAYSPVVSRVIQ